MNGFPFQRHARRIMPSSSRRAPELALDRHVVFFVNEGYGMRWARVCAGWGISNLTKKFPEVAQLEQPTETSKNLETWTFRNLCLISWKPTLGLSDGNLETTEIW